jgi:hypothetical protein
MDERQCDTEREPGAADPLDTGLSPKQEKAVRELVRGKGVVAVARRVGVNRGTLFRWMREPEFVAAMNRWRTSVWEAVRGRMVAVLCDAADAVAKAVRAGDARVALAVLEKMGRWNCRRGWTRRRMPRPFSADSSWSGGWMRARSIGWRRKSSRPICQVVYNL